MTDIFEGFGAERTEPNTVAPATPERSKYWYRVGVLFSNGVEKRWSFGDGKKGATPREYAEANAFIRGITASDGYWYVDEWTIIRRDRVDAVFLYRNKTYHDSEGTLPE